MQTHQVPEIKPALVRFIEDQIDHAQRLSALWHECAGESSKDPISYNRYLALEGAWAEETMRLTQELVYANARYAAGAKVD